MSIKKVFAFVILFLVVFLIKSSVFANKTIISGFMEEGATGYPVQVNLLPADNFDFTPYSNNPEVIVRTENGEFKIEAYITAPTYMRMFIFSGRGIMEIGQPLGPDDDFSTFVYLLEPGDSIHFTIPLKGDVLFSGRGVEKFLYRKALLNEVFSFKRKWSKNGLKNSQYVVYLDSLQDKGLAILDRWRSLLSPLSYTLLKADILGLVGYRKISYYIGQRYLILKDSASKIYRKEIVIDSLKDAYIKSMGVSGNEDTMVLSILYWFYLAQKASNDFEFLVNAKINNWDAARMLDEQVNTINKNYQGDLKERLLAYLFCIKIVLNGLSTSLETQIDKYLISAQNITYKTAVSQKYNSSKLAPKTNKSYYTFNDSIGKEINFDAYKGKVLLIDLWFTGCTGCKTITPELQKIIRFYKDVQNIVFVDISIDTDKNTWIKSLKSGVYGHGNISLYTGGKGENHSFIKEMNVGAYPRLILVGKDGTILNLNAPYPTVNHGKDLVEEINNALKSR